MTRWRFRLLRCVAVGGVGLGAGCAHKSLNLPEGYLPKIPASIDRSVPASEPSSIRGTGELPSPRPSDLGESKNRVFEMPSNLPGVEKDAIKVPKFDEDATPEERRKAINSALPSLQPVGSKLPLDAEALTLADLQQYALEKSPVIRHAEAQVEVQLGQAIQAGLYPNPTVGYQSDQVQPGLKIPPGATFSGAGQQGGFFNQLIKTAHKLSLAQRVAGYDYVNALVAVRRAHLDVMYNVRTQYYAVLVARQNIEVNQALSDLADQVYRLQTKIVTAGENALYEPLQLYAQAVQARNSLVQAEANYKSAWRQMASAIGKPELPVGTLAGKADAPPPEFDPEFLKARLLSEHTDILTRLNTIEQAKTRETLARRVPIPDISFNMYNQYDNFAQAYQYGLQIGVQVPINDRNQGNVRSAQAQVVAAGEELRGTQNNLVGQLAEAYGRYEGATQIVANYRDKVLPSLSQAYRTLIRRYQVEPDKVGFNDIVVAQQNYAQALQSYLGALDTQWKAVVDLANTAQLDEMYPPPAPAPEKK